MPTILSFRGRVCYTLFVAAPTLGKGRGVCLMSILTFILSVLAGVVANHICKWLDERDDGNEPRR